jgi:TetR/AcrR family transcriptional regulator, cholesterol catabolism regulator
MATKEEIAGKFMALAARHGYRRTTIADVVRALRISKKTVYDFFATKEELLEYAVELAAREQRRRVEALLTSATALDRLAQAVAIALADVRRFFQADSQPELEPAEITAKVNDRVFKPMLRDLVAAGVASGEFAVADLDFTVRCCLAIGMEAVRVIQADPSSRPEELALDAMRRLLSPLPERARVDGSGSK